LKIRVTKTMAQKLVYIKLSEIIIDDTIYPRNDIDPETVARYRETLEAGATLPPLVVMPDGKLLDGRHRYEAYRQAGMEGVEVIIEEPEDPDARAVELNLRHGRPLTKEELRQAARRWYGKKPVTEIAKTLGVTRQTVQNWVVDLAGEREEERAEIREKALELRAEGKTQEEVAKELGVPRRTISFWENQKWQSVKNLTHCQDGSKPWVNDRDKAGKTPKEGDQESESIEAEYSPAEPPVPAEELPYEELGVPQQTILRWENQEYSSVKNLTHECAKFTEEDREEEEAGPQTGRQAAEVFRKKHLPCSDMVKEFYHQLKKTSELAEQLVNRKEDLIEAIAGMEADGMSITVLANAVIQACDIYFPRLSEARDVLEEVIKREVKGVVVKDRFVVVTGGGKKSEG